MAADKKTPACEQHIQTELPSQTYNAKLLHNLYISYNLNEMLSYNTIHLCKATLRIL